VSPVGTRQYFDEVETRKYFVEPHIPLFAEFERWRGKKVLEIGCGIGTDTINFARAGAQVSTVDLSEKSMELARKRAATFGLEEQIRFYPGNAEQLSTFVPVAPYDLIYSFGVIHHTPHPEAVLEQLRPYTKPGTVVKIMVYHRKKHGLRVTDVEVDHIFPYRIPDYVKYRYVREWYFRWVHRATLSRTGTPLRLAPLPPQKQNSFLRSFPGLLMSNIFISPSNQAKLVAPSVEEYDFVRFGDWSGQTWVAHGRVFCGPWIPSSRRGCRFEKSGCD